MKKPSTLTNLERIRKELPPARRKKIEARAVQLIAEEMTRNELPRSPRSHKTKRGGTPSPDSARTSG